MVDVVDRIDGWWKRSPHRDVIQREISRVLVLNLSGEKRGARHCKGDLRP